MTTSCPHAHPRRKTEREDESSAPAVDIVDGVWRVRSYELVKEILRAGTTTEQAGFNVDMVREGRRPMKDPILFMDGPEHRQQRSKIARYFAPATVSRRYRDLMEVRAERIVADITRAIEAGDEVDLSRISLGYSVEVAAQVIGLTESAPAGMARRLERMFSMPHQPPRPTVEEDGARPTDLRSRAASLAGRFATIGMSARSLPPLGLFYVRDVRPAIVARRARPEEDVISHLLAEGYDDSEILTECVTYGAAGMVTTREYICIVAWHLLEDPALRARYLGADEAERYALLHEILRLEPVVGHLYRRATEDMTLTAGGSTHHIPAGTVLDLSIRAANADPGAVGDDPLGVCPQRALPKGVRPEAMSFGDGNHRCPGNSLAIQETDILLTRLLNLPIELAGEPRLDWLDLIAGYEVRDIFLRLAA